MQAVADDIGGRYAHESQGRVGIMAGQRRQAAV